MVAAKPDGLLFPPGAPQEPAKEAAPAKVSPKGILRSDPKLFFAIDITLELDERRKRKTTSVDPSFLMFGAAPTRREKCSPLSNHNQPLLSFP